MHYERAGIAFISCLLLGTGIGLLFGKFEIFGSIGFGIGLFAVALLRINYRKPIKQTFD
ncbi:hypothetical protein [Ornithinibacillus halophilus]|uniref:Uncharacterized protein n=1 Tax=Ornithinibacillus halophilus TaxID=930117 RepID=A0A1M5KY32_9BACI|nr:hypothetical protein [Ornithinibacillus halophilus]SHG57615.1 hypothetical protein SAMN05216225_104221 [Ornithinibacillus halophilus]